MTNCIVQQLYRHAVGRLEVPSERDALIGLVNAFERSEYRFKDLMIELALSSGFRTVALEVE